MTDTQMLPAVLKPWLLSISGQSSRRAAVNNHDKMNNGDPHSAYADVVTTQPGESHESWASSIRYGAGDACGFRQTESAVSALAAAAQFDCLAFH